MADLHRLVKQHGAAEAKTLVGPDQRPLVDIAASVMAEESLALGVTYSGFAMTALPHRRLGDAETWERKGHRIRLLIEPGRLPLPGDGWQQYGVPYGSRARMILLYLQTQALRNGSREVELGRSMHDWLARMGLSAGGQTYRDIKEQVNRISACSLTFSWDGDGASGFEKDSIIRGAVHFAAATDPAQGSLWEDRVLLGETFYRELKAHPVPIWEPALRHINNNSASIDIYIWLAYRLHSLSKPTPITWLAVFEQFGAGYTRLRDFRKRFLPALQLALAVYPEAKVEVADEGLVLHPSRPPIPEGRVALLR